MAAKFPHKMLLLEKFSIKLEQLLSCRSKHLLKEIFVKFSLVFLCNNYICECSYQIISAKLNILNCLLFHCILIVKLSVKYQRTTDVSSFHPYTYIPFLLWFVKWYLMRLPVFDTWKVIKNASSMVDLDYIGIFSYL